MRHWLVGNELLHMHAESIRSVVVHGRLLLCIQLFRARSMFPARRLRLSHCVVEPSMLGMRKRPLWVLSLLRALLLKANMYWAWTMFGIRAM